MSRNRNSAKRAGAKFEIVVRDYLSWALNDERLMRGKQQGIHDKGDIANIYFMGQHVCIECKDTARKDYRKHAGEARTEALNLDAPFWWAIQKMPGIGIKSNESIGKQLAYTHYYNLQAMRLEAPDDKLLHDDSQFYTLTKYDGLIFTNLQTLALILNHGQALGPEVSA